MVRLGVDTRTLRAYHRRQRDIAQAEGPLFDSRLIGFVVWAGSGRGRAQLLERALIAGAMLLVTAVAPAAAQEKLVIVNRQRVNAQLVQALEKQYQVPIPSGRYWYDGVAGLWGNEGGPLTAKVLPALPFPSPMPADISTTLPTGVYFNGRALHPNEIMYLARCVTVYPGRYALNYLGWIGFEGGPPLWNLGAALAQCEYQLEGIRAKYGP
jgi:hypothetical protein